MLGTCRYFIILLTAVIFVRARVLTSSERQTVYIDCYRTSGMDSEVVAKAIKEAALLDPTPPYLAQLTCIYKGQGYQNEDGEIVPSEIKQFLSGNYNEEECNMIVDSCNSTGGTTHGEIAYHALACILKHLKKIDELRKQTNKV